MSSLLDLPDPEPPPIQKTVNEPIAAASEQKEKPKSLEVSKNPEPLQRTPEHQADTPKRPPPLPGTSKNRAKPLTDPVAREEPTEAIRDEVVRNLSLTAISSSSENDPETTSAAVNEAPQLETGDVELSVRGYEADRDKIATVRWLATAILITSLVGMIPAIVDVIEHMLSDTSDGVSRWACGLLLVGVLQCAYAVYLVQLPDWSSVWVVTFFTLVIAASYAAMCGLTLLSSDQGHFVQVLDLADRLRGGKATAWCLIMLSLMSLTSYFSGRVGVRWRNAFVG
ncbi:MAG TPA: hypothetical protein VMM76_27875 [Pirellulaceae bacterium]|nr:hypothetical protein [Pirellulaceae bacterium]